jgi:hypothetical protein
LTITHRKSVLFDIGNRKLISWSKIATIHPIEANNMDVHTYSEAPSGDVEMGESKGAGLPMSASIDKVSKVSKFQQSLSSRKTSKDLKWRDIDFKVGDKQILKDCWGHVPTGQICAIMGGSGKIRLR